MTTATATPFLAFLQQQLEQISAEDRLLQYRKKAWDHFLELGLPERKQEAFQYLPLQKLYSQSFSSSEEKEISFEEISSEVLPSAQDSLIVFIDGVFSPKLSRLGALSKQAIVLPLSAALSTYGTHLQGRFQKQLKEERDPFVVLNSALQGEGVFIYVPPKMVLDQPIQCLQITTGMTMASPRVQLFIGAHSEVQWIATTSYLSSNTCFVNAVTDVALEDGASLKMTQQLFAPEGAFHFESLRATLKQDSRLSTVCATRGSCTLRQDSKISLLGENSEASLKGVWMLEKNNQAHFHVEMDHAAPNCRSMQLFKGVLADTSQSSFEGKILVRQAAQKTEAYQLNNNLLLGDRAIANSKPNLEIFADDVKASHGATVAQIDPESLFYLKTRGILESQAKMLLVEGFCKEVVDEMDPSARLKMLGALSKFLEKGAL